MALPSATVILYPPSTSEVVPLVVPFSNMLTPGTGAPDSSVIFPSTKNANDMAPVFSTIGGESSSGTAISKVTLRSTNSFAATPWA